MNKVIITLLVISLIAASAVEMGDSLRARLANRRSKLKAVESASDKIKMEMENNEKTTEQSQQFFNFLNGWFGGFFPPVSCPSGETPESPVTGGDRFFAPAGSGTPKLLTTGQSLKSSSGMYQLIMQTDCNLVLYYANPSSSGNPPAIWATGTYGKGTGCTANVDDNGILTVNTGAGVQLWSSGSSGSSANAKNGNTAWVSANAMNGQVAAYIVQSDGNFVAYQCNSPYWATMTNGRTYLEIADAMKDQYDQDAIPAEILAGAKRKCFGDDILAWAAGAHIPMGYIPREKLNFHDD